MAYELRKAADDLLHIYEQVFRVVDVFHDQRGERQVAWNWLAKFSAQRRRIIAGVGDNPKGGCDDDGLGTGQDECNPGGGGDCGGDDGSFLGRFIGRCAGGFGDAADPGAVLVSNPPISPMDAHLLAGFLTYEIDRFVAFLDRNSIDPAEALVIIDDLAHVNDRSWP